MNLRILFLSILALGGGFASAQTPIQGNALHFDGVDDHVIIPDADALDLTGSYTLECWIRPERFNFLAGLISKYNANPSNGYLLRLGSASPYTGLSFDGMETATGILEADRWYHIAAVNNNGVRTIYVNGVEYALSGTPVNVGANTDKLTLGVDYLPSPRYFKGAMDEVRIWNTARTRSQIRADMRSISDPTPPGLAAYYRFETGTPGSDNAGLTTVTDATGGHHGAATNFSLTDNTSNWVETVSCVKINFPVPVEWTAANYSIPEGGALNGLSHYLDREKAMYFDASAYAGVLLGAMIGFASAYSADPDKQVPVRVYDGTSGSPGAELGSTIITMATIMDKVHNGLYTNLEFDPVITLPASKKIFISVDLTHLQWTDNVKDFLSIYSNFDGQTNPSPIWERQSNLQWYRYTTPGTWNLAASLYIHPLLTSAPAIVTFSSSATTICAGETITFDAAGSTYENGISWDFQGGLPATSEAPLQEVRFDTPGAYRIGLTVQGGACQQIDMKKYVDIIVKPRPAAAVGLAASANNVGAGTPVTFTATPENGGSHPSFTFKVNNQVVQTGELTTWTSASLHNGDVVSCLMTSDAACVIDPEVASNTIAMQISGSLPVTLLSFKARKQENTVLLTWQTTQEVNASRFEIERSHDGKAWEKTGEIKAALQPGGIAQDYVFTDAISDHNVDYHILYYRLKMIDRDRSFAYSRLEAVSFDKVDDGSAYRIYPNPVHSGKVTVEIRRSPAEPVHVQILDLLGREVPIVPAGVTELDVSGFTPGIYLMHIRQGNTMKVRKLVVE